MLHHESMLKYYTQRQNKRLRYAHSPRNTSGCLFRPMVIGESPDQSINELNTKDYIKRATATHCMYIMVGITHIFIILTMRYFVFGTGLFIRKCPEIVPKSSFIAFLMKLDYRHCQMRSKIQDEDELSEEHDKDDE